MHNLFKIWFLEDRVYSVIKASHNQKDLNHRVHKLTGVWGFKNIKPRLMLSQADLPQILSVSDSPHLSFTSCPQCTKKGYQADSQCHWGDRYSYLFLLLQLLVSYSWAFFFFFFCFNHLQYTHSQQLIIFGSFEITLQSSKYKKTECYKK